MMSVKGSSPDLLDKQLPGLEKHRKKDQDIVKIGYLYIKRPPSLSKLRLKAWQKKYFVLRDVSFDDGLSTIEMFDNESSYQNHPAQPEYTLDLNNVTDVERYDASKRFPNAFMVERRGQTPLVLGCMCSIEKSGWMEAVNVLADKRRLVYIYKDISIACEKDKQRRASLPLRIHYEINPIYSGSPGNNEDLIFPRRSSGPPTPPRINNTIYANDAAATKDFIMNKCKGRIVKVQNSSTACQNGLTGDYYMNISPGCITLTSVESLREAIRWPIQHITKFKSEDLTSGENLVTLEASLFCGFAEGSYQFKTFHGRELIKSVKDAASNTQYIIVDSPHSNTNSPLQLSYRQSNGSKQTINQHNSINLMPHPGLTERSLSSPNLISLKVPEIPSRKTGNSTVITEFSTITESHSYLELLDDEHKSTTTETSSVSYSEKIKMHYDDIGTEKRRDSGFSDSETENHMNNHQVNRQIDENHNKSQNPPPLPPKKSRDSCKLVYMDYNEANTVESTPPPIPERQFKK